MIHIDESHSRQPLLKGERLVRYEVNTVMTVAAHIKASRLTENDSGSLPQVPAQQRGEGTEKEEEEEKDKARGKQRD